MAMNTRYLEEYNKLYAGLKTTIIPIEFMEGSPYYHMEIWKFVTSMYVRDVVDNKYMVSTHGRLKNMWLNDEFGNPGRLMNLRKNSNGYPVAVMSSTRLKASGYTTHVHMAISRLVMLHFRFVEGCQFLEVDHRDGNKENNFIWNLQWVSPQENTHRAIKTNLRQLNVKANDGVLLTDEQAWELYGKAKDLKDQYIDLANLYQVPISYIDGLVAGSIRPYIANRFYYGTHTEVKEIPQ